MTSTFLPIACTIMRSALRYVCVIWMIASGSITGSQSAEISLVRSPRADQTSVILISGEIKKGDAARFRKAASNAERLLIGLHSPGGLISEALDIGSQIRLGGWATTVAPDHRCYSACAIIWLSGNRRYFDSRAAIGFHAAYKVVKGRKFETGMGNAEVGAFLVHLGLSRDVIRFATAAPPESLNILTLEAAGLIGVDVLTNDYDQAKWEALRKIDRNVRIFHLLNAASALKCVDINPMTDAERDILLDRITPPERAPEYNYFSQRFTQETTDILDLRDQIGNDGICDLATHKAQGTGFSQYLRHKNSSSASERPNSKPSLSALDSGATSEGCNPASDPDCVNKTKTERVQVDHLRDMRFNMRPFLDPKVSTNLPPCTSESSRNCAKIATIKPRVVTEQQPASPSVKDQLGGSPSSEKDEKPGQTSPAVDYANISAAVLILSEMFETGDGLLSYASKDEAKMGDRTVIARVKSERCTFQMRTFGPRHGTVAQIDFAKLTGAKEDGGSLRFLGRGQTACLRNVPAVQRNSFEIQYSEEQCRPDLYIVPKDEEARRRIHTSIARLRQSCTQ